MAWPTCLHNIAQSCLHIVDLWIPSESMFKNCKIWHCGTGGQIVATITAEVRPDWAPHGTLRFLELAAAGANLNVIRLYKLNFTCITCTCKCNLKIPFLSVSMCMFQWFYLSRWLWWPCILSCCAWLHLGSKFSHGGACCHRRDVDVICLLVWIFVWSQKTKLLLMLICGNDIKRKMTLFELILKPGTKWQ